MSEKLIEGLREQHRRDSAELRRLCAERDSFQRVGIAAQARAERLAEALRECVKDMQRTEDYYGEHPEAQEVISKARAALLDHDQEGGMADLIERLSAELVSANKHGDPDLAALLREAAAALEAAREEAA